MEIILGISILFLITATIYVVSALEDLDTIRDHTVDDTEHYTEFEFDEGDDWPA